MHRALRWVGLVVAVSMVLAVSGGVAAVSLSQVDADLVRVPYELDENADTIALDSIEATRPGPDLVSFDVAPTSVIVGESFRVTITAENGGGTTSDGAINTSILYTDLTDDLSVHDAIAYPDGEGSCTVNLLNPGASLYDRYCAPIEGGARDRVVEMDVRPWAQGERPAATFLVTPHKAGTIWVRARTTMNGGQGAHCDYENDPSVSDDVDQQGWPVERIAVQVVPSSGPTISLISPPTPINGSTIDYDDVTFRWFGNDSDGDVTGYEYELDGARDTTERDSITVDDMSHDSHTFRVRCQDDVNNWSSWVQTTFTISVPPPSFAPIVVFLDPPTPIYGSTIDYDNVTFLWHGVDPDGNVMGYEYELDDGDTHPTTSTSITRRMSEGPHTFGVRCQDDDDNWSLWAVTSFMIDVPAVPAFGTVTGRVTSRHWPRWGIAGASVRADTGQSGITDSEGFYRIENVPVGTQKVTASRNDYYALGYSTSFEQWALVPTANEATVNFTSFAAKRVPFVQVHADKLKVSPGETLNVTVKLRNYDYLFPDSAMSNAEAYVDVSFDDDMVAVGVPSGSGWTEITVHPPGASDVFGVTGDGETYLMPPEGVVDCLVSARRSGPIEHDDEFTFTVPLTVKEGSSGPIGILHRGTIEDQRDPQSYGGVSGLRDQQGWLVHPTVVAQIVDPEPTPPPDGPAPSHLPAPLQKYDDWEFDETWIRPAPSLADLQAQYDASVTTPIAVTIRIERYYGATVGEHLASRVLYRGAVDSIATLKLQVYDLDPDEAIEVKVNEGDWARYVVNSKVSGSGAWTDLSVPVDTVDLEFPSAKGPGRGGGPFECEQTGWVDTQSPMPQDNVILVRSVGTGGKVAVSSALLHLRGVRPIVLVPGYGGEACDYGWHDEDNLWIQLREDYGIELVRPCQQEAHGEHPWVCFEMVDKENDENPDRGSLSRNGEPLHYTVEETKTRYGVDRVNLLGHSKGGLFMREYVEGELHGYHCVENLIALDSVQLGGALVDYYLGWLDMPEEAWDAAVAASNMPRSTLARLIPAVTDRIFPDTEVATKELTETFLSLWNRVRSEVPSVSYHTVVGYAGEADDATEFDPDRWELTTNWIARPIVQRRVLAAAYQLNRFVGTGRGASDPLLTCPEQRIANLPGRENSEASCHIVSANHREAHFKTGSVEAVAGILGLTTRDEHDELHRSCDEWPELTELQGPYAASGYSLHSLDDPQYLLSYTGVLTYGEAVSLTVPVDGTHLEAYVVWEGDEGLDMTLTDPTLRAIDPAVAAVDDNITYDELRGEPAVGYAGYLIADTVVGPWVFEIAAPAAGSEPDMQWELNIAQRSPLSTTLSAIEEEVVEGSIVHLTSTSMTDTLPVLGSAIAGYDKAPDGTLTPVGLLDDGASADGAANDGVYGTLLTASQPGIHTVAITSTGVLPSGVAYMRQAGTSYTVLPASAHFTGLYTEGAVDDDGDGLYDRLMITTTIALDQSGDYEVLGVVSTPEGQELATTIVGASGEAGETPLIEMSFDPDQLIERLADGPFVLSQLRLIDASVTLETDSVTDAFTTAHYASIDFSGWEARLYRDPVDRGLDTGGDAALDILRVKVPLELRRSGDYTVTLDLATGITTTIIGEPVSFTIESPGRCSVVMDFDGTLLALAGDDGPYELTNLVVEGPTGVALSLSEIGETDAYHHGDFGADAASQNALMPPIAKEDGHHTR